MQISQSIRRFLERLGPYQALLVLAVPLAIIEPLKVLALLVVGDGHFIAGTLVMIGAYVASLFVTERLFRVLKPKLLSLSWSLRFGAGLSQLVTRRAPGSRANGRSEAMCCLRCQLSILESNRNMKRIQRSRESRPPFFC